MTRSSMARVLSISVLLAAGLPGVIGSGLFGEEEIIPLRNDYFADEAWVKFFTFSYGADTAIQPTINSEEQELFKELEIQIRTDINVAIATLLERILPESSAALDFNLGNLYFETKRYPDALKAYRTAIDKFPNFRRAHHHMGNLNVINGRFKEAIPKFVKTVELGGASGKIFGLLGYCYLNLQMFEPAYSAYQQALIFEPNSTDWKQGKAQCLINLERWQESIGSFKELIASKPDRPEYWLLQANAYLATGKMLEAAANYEIIRRLGKARPDSLFQLGDIYINRDLNHLALDVYKEALKVPGTVDIRVPIRAAQILASRASWEEASRYIQDIRKRYGKSIKLEPELDLLTLESEIALASGDIVKGVSTLKRIIDRNPLNCTSLLLLAGIQVKDEEQIEDAIFNYEAARKIDECAYRALIDQARMHVERREYKEAIPLLREALDIEPSEDVEDYFEAVVRAELSQSIR